MTLVINNEMVDQVLTMQDTIDVLEQAYADLAEREAICRPRIDIQIPTSDGKVYQWGTMEGGSTRGYFAIRMKSDITYETVVDGNRTHQKYCNKPGLFCGLILLTSVETGEPLAFINDGILQHKRVGADGGIGVKYMSREDSEVVCMLGSGGMARSHMEAFMCVRNIKRLQVYSPTKDNRDAYAEEMQAKWDIEVISCDNEEDAYRDADIVAGCTNASVPVVRADCLRPGMHILNVGGGTGMVSPEAQAMVDIYFRFGNAPAPEGLPEMALADEWVTYAARPDVDNGLRQKPLGTRAHGVSMPEKVIYFSDIIENTNLGRTSSEQITYSERGNLQGNQFHAVAGRTYELAKEASLGHEIPTDWLLQDIRD